MENDNIHTITGGPLKPHEYVVVRREMTAGDEAWIQNHTAKMAGTKKNPQIQLTIGDIKLATLKRMIIEWRLTRTIKSPIDGSEREVEIQLSDQAIENLSSRISTFLNKKIDELNPDDEESDEDFTTAANGRSEGSLKKTKTPHQKG